MYKVWGFCLLLLILEGCTAADPSGGPATAYPPCVIGVNEANVYRGDSSDKASRIFQFAQLTSQNGSIAKREALKMLAGRVQKWSKHVDIQINNQYLFRITITFINPEIVEGVVLNEILRAGTPVGDFPSDVSKQNEWIKRRNELIFLVTLTTNEYHDTQLANDRFILRFPAAQMMLTTSSDFPIVRGHLDHYLEEPLNILAGPVHGYLAYPVAVLKDGICQPVIDSLFTTTLAIHMSDLTINDAVYTPEALNIDYQPLLKIGLSEGDPDLLTPADGDNTQYLPTANPPQPAIGIKTKSNDEYWNEYWKLMSRFVWEHLTYTIDP